MEMEIGKIYPLSELPIGSIFMIKHLDMIHIKTESIDRNDGSGVLYCGDGKLYRTISERYKDECLYLGSIRELPVHYPHTWEDFNGE